MIFGIRGKPLIIKHNAIYNKIKATVNPVAF